MKPAIIIGILLIIVGFVGFSLGGFSFTHEKKDIDAGPIQIGHEQKKTLPIPPALSAIALIGGIGLVVVGARSKIGFLRENLHALGDARMHVT